MTQWLGVSELIAVLTPQVWGEPLPVNASIELRAGLVLTGYKFEHLLVDLSIRNRAGVRLLLEDVHVDVGSDQIVLSFL